MGLENALNAVAVRDLAHGESGVQAGILGADHDAFICLQTLAAAFLHLHIHHNDVALAELRQFAGDLGGFKLRDDGLVQLAHWITPICSGGRVIRQRILMQSPNCAARLLFCFQRRP
ncbi:hypothetical protein D9M70_640820 [compost metagenome]